MTSNPSRVYTAPNALHPINVTVGPVLLVHRTDEVQGQTGSGSAMEDLRLEPLSVEQSFQMPSDTLGAGALMEKSPGGGEGPLVLQIPT